MTFVQMTFVQMTFGQMTFAQMTSSDEFKYTLQPILGIDTA
jgi:hypothetical protein